MALVGPARTIMRQRMLSAPARRGAPPGADREPWELKSRTMPVGVSDTREGPDFGACSAQVDLLGPLASGSARYRVGGRRPLLPCRPLAGSHHHTAGPWIATDEAVALYRILATDNPTDH